MHIADNLPPPSLPDLQPHPTQHIPIVPGMGIVHENTHFCGSAVTDFPQGTKQWSQKKNAKRKHQSALNTWETS